MAAALRLVDTSAWIEWLVGSALGKRLGKQIPDKQECIVPTIVQLELSKWLARELGDDQADQMIAYTQKCVVVPLDTSIALLAAHLTVSTNWPPPMPSFTQQPGTRGRSCSPVMAISRDCPTWHCSPRPLEDTHSTDAP
ncbi:PIN domain-containing protein [Luteimonas sp. A478]